MSDLRPTLWLKVDAPPCWVPCRLGRGVSLVVAVNPVGLDPQLRDAIERARPAVEAAKARQRERRADRVPLPAEARDAISRLIADGTYARAVASVVVEDPDLSDS